MRRPAPPRGLTNACSRRRRGEPLARSEFGRRAFAAGALVVSARQRKWSRLPSLTASLLLLQLVGVSPTTPFAVGETLEYSARYGILRPGSARLAVAAIDTVRGVPAWRFSFEFEVAVLGLFANSTELTSWTGIADFASRRFLKNITENGRVHRDDFAIFPDSGYSRRLPDSSTSPTSARPIDDVAFLYFLRSTPLRAGESYSYNTYWRPTANPVTVRVLGTETITLPDGSKVACLVLHPIVEERNGMFARRARARLWLTDDERRLPVQIQSTYSFGTVKLVLTRVSITPAG